jgi:membrane-bound ClpP family serine protease
MIVVLSPLLGWSGSEGHVFTHGERWQTHGAEVLAPGETVEVAGMKDLTLVMSGGDQHEPSAKEVKAHSSEQEC